MKEIHPDITQQLRGITLYRIHNSRLNIETSSPIPKGYCKNTGEIFGPDYRAWQNYWSAENRINEYYAFLQKDQKKYSKEIIDFIDIGGLETLLKLEPEKESLENFTPEMIEYAEWFRELSISPKNSFFFDSRARMSVSDNHIIFYSIYEYLVEKEKYESRGFESVIDEGEFLRQPAKYDSRTVVPEIYDTPRPIRIVDGKTQGINFREDGRSIASFDLDILSRSLEEYDTTMERNSKKMGLKRKEFVETERFNIEEEIAKSLKWFLDLMQN